MARPKKDDPRNTRYVVRFSPEEAEKLTEAAAKEGVSIATYMRRASLGRKPPGGRLDRDSQREIWRQVAGVARNVNQIARAANAGALKPGELERLTDEVRGLTAHVLALTGREEEA